MTKFLSNGNIGHMVMNKITRVQKISEIMSGVPYGKQDILWKGNTRPMNVYEIPLSYLIYNKYNGRILSGTKTLESQGKMIDPETDRLTLLPVYS